MEENKAPEMAVEELITLLRDLVRPIVDTPDSVSVTADETEDSLVLTLRVAEDDVGMIIGKHGKIARALRTVIKAASKSCDKKVTVEIK